MAEMESLEKRKGSTFIKLNLGLAKKKLEFSKDNHKESDNCDVLSEEIASSDSDSSYILDNFENICTDEGVNRINNEIETLPHVQTSPAIVLMRNVSQGDIIQDESDTNMVATTSLNLSLTKKGLPRKRKLFQTPRKERIEGNRKIMIAKHEVRAPCHNCKLKCGENIDEKSRRDINQKYWNLSPKSRKWFISKNTKQGTVRRRTTAESESRRQNSYKYDLQTERGDSVGVCRTFFLTTLGYDGNNNSIIKTLARNRQFHAPGTEKRGKYVRSNTIDKSTIKEHIESYKPTISHYRREHAPNRRYLPSDITISLMHKDYNNKHQKKISYEMYRKEVVQQNISFASLGHEECWHCEKIKFHEKDTNHKRDIDTNCDICNNWRKHHERYTEARQQYEEDCKNIQNQQTHFSADLQKIIMLPRCDMFKEVIFMHRLIAYHESFVPIGKGKRNTKSHPVAIIWHEGIAGRHKEDIISAFYAFFVYKRDETTLTIWLDNCAAQNKNWTLFSFFSYIVNSNDVQLETLEVKYFEPGHTFMSADSFHHQVERSLKQKNKVYDFIDFRNCVESATSNVHVIELNIENFYTWNDYTSPYKIKKMSPRVYLKEIVHVKFKRGDFSLYYKKTFSEKFTILSFVKADIIKKRILPKPKTKTMCRCISSERKNEIITKVKNIMPTYKLYFWKNLPVNQNETNNDSD